MEKQKGVEACYGAVDELTRISFRRREECPEVVIERYDLRNFSPDPILSSRIRWRQQGNEGFEDR
jgi:hypothetical protein